MTIDFERDLSELLHTVTPEPPEGLAPPRVATLRETSRTDAGATLIELTPRPDPALSRRRLWPAALTAAAVASLAAGVVALTQIGNPSTHQSPGTRVTSPNQSHVTTGTPCNNDQLVLSQSPHVFTTQGSAGTAQLIYRNTRSTRCTLVLPSVTIGAEVTGGTPFPTNGESVVIPGKGQLVIAAHVQVTGQCRKVTQGVRINLIRGGFTYSFWLGVTGCTLTPVSVTHQVVG